jgi:hypothetical protein
MGKLSEHKGGNTERSRKLTFSPYEWILGLTIEYMIELKADTW